MGTTRIKVIDLSSDQKEIKTSRKHAEKLAGPSKLEKKAKEEKHLEKEPKATNEPKESKVNEPQEVSANSQSTDVDKIENQDIQAEEVKTSGPSGSSVTSVTSKKHLHHKGAKYQAAKKLLEDKTYSAQEALDLLPKTSITKFDPAVEVHVNVVDKSIRAKVTFPHASGAKQKQKTVLVFAEKALKVEDQKIIMADDKTIAEIDAGKLKAGKDFDAVISTPQFMPQLAKIAKILGPKGLMPNPKNGTVTDDPQKYFAQSTQDQTEFKTDPTAPIIHAKIGKLSKGEKQLSENLKALIFAIGPTKIQKATLTSTMGPGIKLDITSLK